MRVTLAVISEGPMPRTSKPRPRRDSGAGSVFERTTTTRQGKVITRHVGSFELPPGLDGKRKRRTVYGTSWQDALERMQKAKQQYAAMGNLSTSDPTVKQWCELWLTNHGRRLKPQTLAGYRSKINGWIVPQIGRQKLSRLSPDHVRGLYRVMKEAGAAPNHVHGVHRVLSSVLADAVREERVGRNVAKIAGGPPQAKADTGAMTVQEAVAVLEAAALDRLGTRWLAALCLGIRQGERLGLRWSHVDLDAGKIDVRWALARVPWAHGCGEPCGLKSDRCSQRHPAVEPTLPHEVIEANYILQPPKGRPRVIPVPDVLLDPLHRRREAVLAEKPDYTFDHDLVWCRPDGGPIRPRDDWQTYKDLLAECGIERDFTQHELRHTTVTLLMELGVDRSVIQEIVGHSDVLTQEIYKHVNLEFARRALDTLGTTLSPRALMST